MEQGEAGILIVAITILILLGSFLVFIFLIFIRRKNTLIKNNYEAEQHFKQEIINTQIEIREETLRNISWELHDNIGQLMTLAKIQAQNAQDNPEKMEAVSEIIGKGLNELRALSKSINPETIRNLDFEEAIKVEMKRFNRLNFIVAKLAVSGEKIEIDTKISVILFRILQEFFSNTLKHAQATKLEVTINYTNKEIIIIVKDNGVGIKNKGTKSGQGLKNMSNRAELINAHLKIDSVQNKGTTLQLKYIPLKTKKDEL